jgi:hypothetical protein
VKQLPCDTEVWISFLTNEDVLSCYCPPYSVA